LRHPILLPLVLTAPIFWSAIAPLALAESEFDEIANPPSRNVVAVVPRSWPPQYQLNSDGTPGGFAIDVMEEVALRAGLTVTYIVTENFPEAVDTLSRGDADLIPNVGILPERMGEFAFTEPVETFVISLFVRSDSDDIKGVADLPGKKLAVVEKNIGLIMFGKRQDIDVQVYPDERSALFQLISGQVDALVYPQQPIQYLARGAGIENRIRVVGEPIKEVKRGISVLRSNVTLFAALNAAVKDFVPSAAYQRIYTKWYGRPTPFWTATSATWSMGVLAVLLLVAMALWRYHSVLLLNRNLRESIEDRIGAEAKYESILRISVDAIISIDENQIIRIFNQGAEAIFGYSADEVLGKNLDMLLPARFRQAHRSQIVAFLSFDSGSIAMKGRRDLYGLRRDGTEFPAEGFATKLDQGGEKIYTVTLSDISDRREAEKAVRKAKENAEAANRAKSEFLANMSHELRTPLNAIIGFSEVIKDEMYGPLGNTTYREYAGDINDSGQHLLDLINDILDLSKVESGLEELHEDCINVPEVIRSVLQLVRQRAENQGLELKLECPDNLPLLFADKRKLMQILANLLTNAIKFTAKGGTVTLTICCGPDTGYIIQVTDTGIGIAPEDIPKALSQFGQIDGDLNRKYQGTGLGLPLTTALLKMHGGNLDLQSQVGIGTTATVHFPATRLMGSRPETRLGGVDTRKAS
jgi:PAS domain S-box-containing protein